MDYNLRLKCFFTYPFTRDGKSIQGQPLRASLNLSLECVVLETDDNLGSQRHVKLIGIWYRARKDDLRVVSRS